MRDTCDSDGRGCFAVLTDKGAELLSRARPTHLGGVHERFLRHFSEEELEMLADCWNRVLPGAADVTAAVAGLTRREAASRRSAAGPPAASTRTTAPSRSSTSVSPASHGRSSWI